MMVKRNWRKSRIIFLRENEHLVYLCIYSANHIMVTSTPKTTKARNLKFGQIISLYINLRPCNFGVATSRGLGHMHPKLVTAKFIK